MSKLYTNIFDRSRNKIWKRLSKFSSIGYLGGGTALALQINHRISYDFDIFTCKSIEKSLLTKVIIVFPNSIIKPLIDNQDELTIEVDGVKLTFLYYPFKNILDQVVTESLSLLDIKDIAADKAYTIGRRGAWRDYYDIYSILGKKILNLAGIIKLANQKFGPLFNEKLFLEQLTYCKDIMDFSIETVEKDAITPEKVQERLKDLVKDYISKTLKN